MLARCTGELIPLELDEGENFPSVPVPLHRWLHRGQQSCRQTTVSCVMVGSAPKGSFLHSGLYGEAGFERVSPVLCWGNVAATNFTVDSASMT